MKQVAQSLRHGEVRVLDVPPPTLRPHGVLVCNAWSLISSGTERAKVDLGQKSLLAKARSRPDQVKQVVQKIRRDGLLQTYRTVMARLEEQNPLGYSSAGTVTAVGELAPGLSPGDRVACAGGEYANHAEMVYVPATLCARVPETVDLDEAAFTTIGAVALQGVRQSGVVLGERVAVVGLGLLGQLTVQILRAAGCEVAGVDPDAARRKLATDFGALLTVSPGDEHCAQALLECTQGKGFDAVIITAATSGNGPVELAATIARDRGTVVVVGDVGLRIPRAPFYEKELTLRLSRSYGPGRYDPLYEELALDYPIGHVRWTEQRNMEEFLRLLAEHKVEVRPLVTHRFPIERAPEAYRLMTQEGSSPLAVLLEYPGQQATASRILLRADQRATQDSTTTHGTASVSSTPRGKIGVGLLGAGNFATATLLPALMGDRRFAPRGVYTVSGLSARDVAERYRFAFCASSPQDVLSDPETRAVVIATRHASHAELAQLALHAGKVVFVEKPLAITEEQLEKVVAVQRETGGLLTAGFNRRFSPLSRQAARELRQRSSPLTLLIRVNAGPLPADHWIQRLEEGGGRIVGEVCHFVDLAAFLVGRPALAVHAVSAGSDKAVALRDTLAVTLTYSDGSIATILYAATGDTAYPKERIEAYWESTVLVLDDFRSLTLVRDGKVRKTKLSQPDKGHRAEMQAFLDFAEGKPIDVLTFADCVSSTAATFKIIESLGRGTPVVIPPVVAEDGDSSLQEAHVL